MDRSGSVPGYGDVAGRVRSISQVLSATGAFVLEFPEEYDAFSFQISGALVAARSVLVGFGTWDPAGMVTPAVANDVFDPIAISGVTQLTRKTRWVYVYVGTATASAVLTVTGYQGDYRPRMPSAAEISAALAAVVLPVTITGAVPVTAASWAASSAVAMGAASATIINPNAARVKLLIENTGAVDVAIRLAGAAAVFANDIKLVPGASFSDEASGQRIYTGEVRGITAGAAGEVRVTEAT